MTPSREVLVTGATGLQGGAVARRLLADGFAVRVLTRNPESPAAQLLARQGARPVLGDLFDVESLKAACRGAAGVFSVQNFWEHGQAAEVRQGGNLVAAAKSEGVDHFVYASVGGAERTQGLGISHFESKAEIESQVRESGLSYTIVRPVSFFENFTTEAMLKRIYRQGEISFPFPGDRPFQLVAVADEADFAALAFSDPQRFHGVELELASDRLTLSDLADVIASAAGVDVAFREVPMDAFADYIALIESRGQVARTQVGRSLHPQLSWNRASPVGGWNADLDRVRSFLPKLRAAGRWASSIDWLAARQQWSPPHA